MSYSREEVKAITDKILNMAKADAKKNYYVDLEVPPTASVDDIKKQFRKLGIYCLGSMHTSKAIID